jgi:hypothetical protein
MMSLASVASVLLAILACSTTTSTSSEGPTFGPRSVRPVLFASVSVHYSPTLDGDRRQRAIEGSVAERVQEKMLATMDATGLLGGQHGLDVELTEFRLPAGARWMTGPMKGNDYLASHVEVRDGESVLAASEISTQLGAMDRSIGENYSADFALENMIDNLAWMIVFEASAPGQDGQAVRLATVDGVVPAVQEAGWRGDLDYGEVLKYAATDAFRGQGKLSVCASSLSKPDGVPAFLWDFPAFGLHGYCSEIAEQHRWRRKSLVPE